MSADAKYQVLPDLSPEDYEALKVDIAQRGVLVPVEYDEDGNVLDGYHRVRICGELGITDWPRFVRKGLSEDEKRTHARQLNLARRHLSQAQKRDLIADQLREAPEKTDRQVAAGLGVDHKTVGSVRTEKEELGEIPQVEVRKGKISYPAERKPIRTAYVDPTPEGKQETLAQAKGIRSEKATERRKERTERLVELSNKDAPLPTERKYPILYADPPWKYEHLVSVSREIENHYPPMELADICALDVASLATPDAMLFLWVPSPILEQSFQVLRAWGFDYRTQLVWDKTRIGMGYYVRQQHENLLLASRGKPIVPEPGAQPPSVVSVPRGEHSAKPDEFRDIIKKMYPELPKIELFSRSPYEGFDAWGNEAEAA